MAKSKILLLLVLGAIPIQLNKFFWPSFSFVLGIPIDYLAPAIYFLDILIISFIIIFLLENFRKLRSIFLQNKNFFIALSLFNLYLILDSIFFSLEKAPSFYFDLKFLEFSLFASFASYTLSDSNFFRKSIIVGIFSLAWQGSLVILQFVFQRSLGFWFLGERAFDSETVSIAHGQIGSFEFLRPYGTFSHPNIAGAFFVIIFLIIFPHVNQVSKKIVKIFSNETLKFFVVGASLVGIGLSFSKAAIISVIVGYLFIKEKFSSFLLKSIFLVLLLIVFLRFLPESQVPSIAERLLLAQASLNISLKNPLFGVGSNNFIKELASLNLLSLSQIRLLQPVHNVFLLILSENGIVGLLLFTLLLFFVLREATSKFKIALFLTILIFALVDHFLWTLEQGQLLFWVSISYILSKPKFQQAS